MKYWTKSALTLYRYLHTMTSTIDKVIMEMGKNSNSTNINNQQNTYFQASKMIELMDRKRKMINLKVAVEHSLSKLDKMNRRIMTLVFIDGVKSEQVSQLFGISIRTFFRKKQKALREVTMLMEELGFDEDFFESEYFGEKWFMKVYDNCVSRDCDTDELDRYLVKGVLNEVSRIGYSFNTYLV